MTWFPFMKRLLSAHMQVVIGMDVASSEFHTDGMYDLDFKVLWYFAVLKITLSDARSKRPISVDEH